MIRVVSGPIPYKTRCRACKSELEYDFNEIKVEKIFDYLGGADNFYHITCPVCSNSINVGEHFHERTY